MSAVSTSTPIGERPGHLICRLNTSEQRIFMQLLARLVASNNEQSRAPQKEPS